MKLPMRFHPDPDGSGKLRWWSGRQWLETYQEFPKPTLRDEITEAVEDFSRPGLYPPPFALAPNLQLASRALAEITRLEAELYQLKNPPPEPPECQACYTVNGHKEGCPAS